MTDKKKYGKRKHNMELHSVAKSICRGVGLINACCSFKKIAFVFKKTVSL